MESTGKGLIRFYAALRPPPGLPGGIEVLYPQQRPEVQKISKKFYQKFYADNEPRRLIIGINPGRFGAGITGINFTAPRQLKENCGIDHPFGNSSELSAEFIYEMIDRYGGASRFYKDYFISSVSPLGFVQEGKNLNYYDNKKLQDAIRPFVNECLDQQLSLNFKTDYCICIGGEKNYKFLSSLNEERKDKNLRFFDKIIPLPHPRFILQYRRKQKEEYLLQYIQVLKR